MQPRAAALLFTSQKHCFVNIPKAWSSSIARDRAPVFEIQGEQATLFASWSGGTTSGQHDTGLEVIEVNGLYASKLGFQHGQEVLVSGVVGAPECHQVHVDPLSVDDWEILELHASFIESNLLNQLRVVWTDQVVPVWVQKTVCIYAKISHIEPRNARCCLLQNNTEVFVAPKMRSSRSGNQPPSHKRAELNGPIAGENTNASGHGERGTTKDLEGDRPNASRDIQPDNGFVQKVFTFLNSWWSGEPETEGRTSEDNSARDQSILPRTETVDIDLSLTLRVEDLDYLKIGNHGADDDTDLLESPTCISLGDQSSTVYIHFQTLLSKYPALEDSMEKYRSFLAVMWKLNSPAERESKLKKKMEKSSQRRSEITRRGTATDDILEDAEVDNPKVVVRVVLLDEQKVCRLKDGNRDTAEIEFDRPGVMLRGHVMVPQLLRRQLGLEVTGRVQLSGVKWPAAELTGLALHPLFEKPEHFTPDMMRMAVNASISSSSSSVLPLLLSQGTLIKCFLKQDLDGEFVITMTCKSSTTSANTNYCLLTPEVMQGVKVQVSAQLTPGSRPREVPMLPFWNTQQFDFAVPKISLKQLGGISCAASEIVEHIQSCLGQSPLTTQLFSGQPGLHNGGVLLCAGKGGGKSALARAICHQAAELPWLAYVAVVECKQLRGKRVESIRKLLERTFNEAAWRQPSLILLDDLDHVTAAPSGPEQEMSGEAVYYTRVAEVLKDLLKLEMRAGSHIAVMATSRSRSSVHQSLVSSHGNHFFQKILTLKPPDKADRQAILKAILTSKTSVAPSCINDLDLQGVTSRSEGYVPRDLEMVIDRAIHAHLMTNPVVEDSAQELVLTDEDFTVAFDGFSPTSLRNVSLHKAGETGWCDVGGLHDIRKTLVETLQWPSKYPELFASCPLRLRSGLLLYGAPGTGKTLLAGVVAKECSLNFISIKGPELLSKYIGASEQAVRDTFVRAQSAKPCILFFDEFDSLAPRRGHDSTGVTDRVVNQLLTQLDGVEGLEGVYVLAATSRPDLIDPALLRPGRLDKALHCGLPTEVERLEILQALTHKMTLDADVDLEVLAKQCQYFTGADFKALLYNAQLEAIHEATGLFGASREKSTSTTSTSVSKDLAASGDETIEEGTAETLPGDAMVMEKPLPEDATPEQPKYLDSDVIYMPNLEEGATDLCPEVQRKLHVEISQLEPSNNNNVAQQDKRPVKAIQIKQCHLVNGLEGMGPSVSASERSRYQMIYQNFVASRGGNFSDGIQTAGKKATLA